MVDIDQGFAHLQSMATHLQSEIADFENTVRQFAQVTGDARQHLEGLISRMGQVHASVTDAVNKINFLRTQTADPALPSNMESVFSQLQQAHGACTAVKNDTQAFSSQVAATMAEEVQVILPASQPTGLPTMLCCDCGTPMEPNPARRCVNCLKSDIDITEGIQRHVIVQHCDGCDRWNRPPWVAMKPESPELLSMCLKKVRNLEKVKIVEAKFLYTDPSHKLMRARVVIEKEVLNKAILRQGMTIEFKPTKLQCSECALAWTPHTLNTTVHVRQRSTYKRTILFLENMIRKADAHKKSIAITSQTDGLDFHFSNRNAGLRFADFVLSNFPGRKMESQKLVTHEEQNDTAHLKHAIAVELAPVSKDDLILLSPKMRKALGGVPAIMLCSRVSNLIELVDPFSLRGTSLRAKDWWREALGFEVMMSRQQLTDYVVLDTEEITLDDVKTGGTARRFLEGTKRKLEKSQAQSVSVLSSRFPGSAIPTGKFRLVDLELARVADLGQNDDRIHTRTHIGLHMKVGDVVSGYDIRGYNRMNVYNESGVQEEDLAQFPVFICKIKKHEEACLDVEAWDSQAISSTAYKKKAAMMGDVGRVDELDPEEFVDKEDYAKMHAELEEMLHAMSLD